MEVMTRPLAVSSAAPRLVVPYRRKVVGEPLWCSGHKRQDLRSIWDLWSVRRVEVQTRQVTDLQNWGSGEDSRCGLRPFLRIDDWDSPPAMDRVDQCKP